MLSTVIDKYDDKILRHTVYSYFDSLKLSKTRSRKSQPPNSFFLIKVFDFLFHHFSRAEVRVIVNRKKVKLDSVDEYLSFEMVRGKMKQKSNRKDNKGRPKQKGKKINCGRR